MPQFGASLSDDARGIIYDRKMFVIQATGAFTAKYYGFATVKFCIKAVLTIYSQFQVYQTSTLAYYGIHTFKNTSKLYFTVHAPRGVCHLHSFIPTQLFVCLREYFIWEVILCLVYCVCVGGGEGIALLANITLGIKCLKVTYTLVYHEGYKTYYCCDLNPQLCKEVCVCVSLQDQLAICEQGKGNSFTKCTFVLYANVFDMYEKTTCQSQIKFISDDCFQKYKTFQLFTSLFTTNTNIFISIKVIKDTYTHIYINTNIIKNKLIKAWS